MKRRRIILLLALAVGVAAVAILWPRGPREPVYEGKRLSEWLEDCHGRMVDEDDKGVSPRRDKAVKSIRAMGTNALPWLMAEFTKSPSKWRLNFNRWSGRHTRGRFQLDDGSARMVRAVAGLQLLGSDIAPALPELARWLGDPEQGSWAAQAMEAGGAQALPYFLHGISGTNIQAEISSVIGLGMLALRIEAAVPPLVQSLQSPNPYARKFAVSRLEDVQHYPELVIPALHAALSDSDPDVRRTALQSLVYMRKNSAPLIPDLRRQMQDTNPAVVLTASNALHLLQSTHLPPPAP